MPATSSLDGVRPTRQIVANHAASATWSQVRPWHPPRRLQPDRVFGMAYDWDGLFSQYLPSESDAAFRLRKKWCVSGTDNYCPQAPGAAETFSYLLASLRRLRTAGDC